MFDVSSGEGNLCVVPSFLGSSDPETESPRLPTEEAKRHQLSLLMLEHVQTKTEDGKAPSYIADKTGYKRRIPQKQEVVRGC